MPLTCWSNFFQVSLLFLTHSLWSIHTDSFLLPSSSSTPLFLTAKTKSYQLITTSSGPLKLTLDSVVAMTFIYLSSGVAP